MVAEITSADVYSRWVELREILERHEELIRKRWLKRSREQRKKLLLSIWPEMSAHHRPDFRMYSQECRTKTKIRGQKAFQTYAFPSINLEDLLDGRTFLLFLNSRGRHHPEAFVHVDCQTISLGKNVGPISTAFLEGYTMMLRGQTTPGDYGKLLSWETDDRAREYYHSGVQQSFGVGLIVLAIQDTTFSFLTDSCCALLQDHPAKLRKGDVKPAPAPIESIWTKRPSMASIIAETPYRVPPLDPDLDRIRAILAAKRSAALDHIFALREDPGYFSEIVKDLANHRPETLPATAGGVAPSCNSASFWNKTLEDVLQRAYFYVRIWEILYDEVSNVAQLQKKYSGPFSWDSHIPDEFSHAVVRLVCFCYREARSFLLHLDKHLPASPPMRSKFLRKPHAYTCGCCGSQPKGTIKPNDILWVFQLMRDEKKALELGLSNLLDEYDRRLRQDPKQKDLITPLVDHAFSDLVVVAECIRQLEMMPWARKANSYAGENRPKVDDELDALETILRDFDAQLHPMSLADVGCPSHQFFHYPVDKRRTRETTDQLRLAEQRLDAFWAKFDGGLSGDVQEFVASISPTREQLQRTPEWVEPAPPLETPAKPQDPAPAYVPFLRLAIHDGPDPPPATAAAGRPAPPKVKVKTRGTPHGNADPSPDAAPAPAPAPAIPEPFQQRARVPVSKRALEAFVFLFPAPARDFVAGTRGELPWVDFLHAMERTGFALEKLHGSAWQFTPAAAAADRPGGRGAADPVPRAAPGRPRPVRVGPPHGAPPPARVRLGPGHV